MTKILKLLLFAVLAPFMVLVMFGSLYIKQWLGLIDL